MKHSELLRPRLIPVTPPKPPPRIEIPIIKSPVELARIKAKEFRTAVTFAPDPPDELIREIVRVKPGLIYNATKKAYEETVHRLCDYYNIPRPKVMTYREARKYVEARKPGWHAAERGLRSMYDSVKPEEPLGIIGFVSSSFRGQARGMDAIVFSNVLLQSGYDVLRTRNAFHEFFHWFFEQSVPTLPPPAIKPFSNLVYGFEQDAVAARAMAVLGRVGVRA